MLDAAAACQSRLSQTVNRLFPHVASVGVMGESVEVLAEAIRVNSFDNLDDACVARATMLLQQSTVGDFVGQRVFE